MKRRRPFCLGSAGPAPGWRAGGQIADGSLDPAAGTYLIWADITCDLDYPEELKPLAHCARNLDGWEEGLSQNPFCGSVNRPPTAGGRASPRPGRHRLNPLTPTGARILAAHDSGTVSGHPATLTRLQADN